MAQEPQLLDVNVQPLYDTQTILAAGALSLTYFQAPIGAGQSNFAAAGVTKSLADTNMTLAGQLPAGYNFRVLGIRAQPMFSMNAADAARWSIGGVLRFTIASKDYLQLPLDTVPAGAGPYGFFTQAMAANQSVAAHGFPSLGNAYVIGKKPLELSATQNFVVTLQWPALVTVTSTVPTQVAAGLPVRIYLDGFYYRPVQ